MVNELNIVVEGNGQSDGKKAVGNHVFAFRDCNYSVNVKGGKRQLLNGINGTVHSGEVLAIMGPSGAGKTTLLNLLTLGAMGGDARGNVTLNGHILDAVMFRKYCALVTQFDHHWAFLTCRESLEYAADLYLDCSAAERKNKVDDLIKEMGLASCENTRCGNQFVQGLSNGQRRRLSLALALIKEPLLLFLDEPTSGLDAAAAASIMAFLKELAAKRDIIVCCTIHQPSTAVFDGFDGTMVLSSGKIAYNGAAAEVVSYVDNIGKPMPDNTNPAEYLLDLVNREFTDPKEVDEVMTAWEQKAVNLPAVSKFPVPERSRYGNGFLSQLVVLLRRHGVLTVRDPSLYLGRVVMMMFSCIFFCFIYWEARTRNQDQALYRMWLMLWTVGVPTNLAVIAVFAFNLEFNSLKREIRDGMFHPFAFLVSNLILQLPLMFIMTLCTIGVSTFAISNFYASNFIIYWITFTSVLFSFESMAQALSVQFDNPLLGMLAFMNNWFTSFLFSGLVVAEKDVIWPFRAFNYIFPFKYSISALTKIEYDQAVEFDGAVLDPTNPQGFSCAGRSTLQCYGRTGDQVLRTLGNNFQSLSPDTNVFEMILAILAIAAVFKIFYFINFYRKTTAMHQPKSA